MKCNKNSYVLNKCPFFWLYKSNWFVLDGNGFIYIIYDVCFAALFCSISRQFSSSFCFYNIHFIFQHAINRSFDSLGVSMYAYMSVHVLRCERFYCLWFRSSSVFYVFTLSPSYTRTACYMVTKYGKEDVHSFVHLLVWLLVRFNIHFNHSKYGEKITHQTSCNMKFLRWFSSHVHTADELWIHAQIVYYRINALTRPKQLFAHIFSQMCGI